MRQETLTIEESLPKQRLDTFLRGRLPDVSRGAIQRLIDEGHIRVNGDQVKPTHHPKAGDKIEITWPDPRPAEALPENIPLEILFEDADLLVLNKPPGLVVHPAVGNEEHTLVNALLHHCAGHLSGIGGVARPGIVHRLDKDTSGCLVVAKNDAAHVSLAAQFAGREVEKIYSAILCGEVPKLSGDIRGAIARHPTHRQLMAVTAKGGRESWTAYKVVERLRGATWVEATLHTGRTHQIRVHFQHLGFPVAGDEIYGPRQNIRLGEVARYRAPRQMLHAMKLGLNHPRTGERLTFQAPLPADFSQALKSLRVQGL